MLLTFDERLSQEHPLGTGLHCWDFQHQQLPTLFISTGDSRIVAEDFNSSVLSFLYVSEHYALLLASLTTNLTPVYLITGMP
jgi:hypothetical protein